MYIALGSTFTVTIGKNFPDNQVSGASAFADCYAKITAKTLALAVASSAAESGCFIDETGADAATSTLAAFKLQLTEIEKCDIDSSEVGLADADSNGGANVAFVRLPNPPCSLLLSLPGTTLTCFPA